MSSSSGDLGIVCDFDGTITIEDMAVTLLRVFAPDTWDLPFQEFTDGEINVEQLIRQQFSHVRAAEGELIDYAVADAKIRAGYPELVEYCRTRAIPLEIASAGLEFYIAAILQHTGVAVPRLDCGRAEFTSDGILVSYAHLARDPGEEELDLKERVVERMRRAGRTVVYIGDGFPDLEAARRADLVFARWHLAEACAEQSIEFRHFDDFYDVMNALAEWPTSRR